MARILTPIVAGIVVLMFAANPGMAGKPAADLSQCVDLRLEVIPLANGGFLLRQEVRESCKRAALYADMILAVDGVTVAQGAVAGTSLAVLEAEIPPQTHAFRTDALVDGDILAGRNSQPIQGDAWQVTQPQP